MTTAKQIDVCWADETPGTITYDARLGRDPVRQSQRWTIGLTASWRGQRIDGLLWIPFSVWDALSGDEDESFQPVDDALTHWARHCTPVTLGFVLHVCRNGDALRIEAGCVPPRTMTCG
jgi:hypothetical protein